jgi:hypothetical protein
MVLSSLLALGQVLVDSSFAPENMTSATNDTGTMMGGNQTNQTVYMLNNLLLYKK